MSVLAFLIGCFAGLRSLTPLAAVAWAAHLGWLPLEGPLAFLCSGVSVTIQGVCVGPGVVVMMRLITGEVGRGGRLILSPNSAIAPNATPTDRIMFKRMNNTERRCIC